MKKLSSIIANEQSFLDAARLDNLQEIEQLLQQNPSLDINIKDEDGYTALIHASVFGYKEVVHFLLDKGAELDAQDSHYGYTALMHASWQGHSEIVKLLLNKGADIHAKNSNGFTVLMCASASILGDTETVQFLIDFGADIHAKDGNGRTALNYSSYAKTTQLLLNNGADVNAKDNEGQTVLMRAPLRGMETVQLLINAGADVNIKDNDGETALTFATEFGYTEIADYLRSVGARE